MDLDQLGEMIEGCRLSEVYTELNVLVNKYDWKRFNHLVSLIFGGGYKCSEHFNDCAEEKRKDF